MNLNLYTESQLMKSQPFIQKPVNLDDVEIGSFFNVKMLPGALSWQGGVTIGET